MFTIFRKELADHFSSVRFLILFCLIVMVALVTTYMVGANLRQALEGVSRPEYVFLFLFSAPGQFLSLSQFIAFFGPLIGLVMGFDAINRERSAGTLSKLLAQPIYRDAVINGKFLAGVVTISIMLTALILLITGVGLLTVGVAPGWEEGFRVFTYLVVSIAYVSFWLGLSILFSILFRSVATSALASLALWIFFSFFMGFTAGMAADIIAAPDNPNDPEQIVAHEQVKHGVSLISPSVLYSEATSTILDPFRKTTQNFMLVGELENISMNRFQNPLPFGQSLLVVWPYLTTMAALTVIIFGLSYLVFMRQEVRSV